MSLEKLKKIFSLLENNTSFSISLLRINNSKRNGLTYINRALSIPSSDLLHILSEISQKYIKDKDGILNSVEGLDTYKGMVNENIVYKINSDDSLLSESYKKFDGSFSNPDVEINPFELKPDASVLSGKVKINNKEITVRLVSMQRPFTILRNKFYYFSGAFKKCADKVLSVRTNVDVICLDDSIYMFNTSGEKLFDLERTYNQKCKEKLVEIKNFDLVSNFELLRSVAVTGYNPRRFLSFNQHNLECLKKIDVRNKIAKKFELEIKDDKLLTENEVSAEKLIKLLCNRGMLDPFTNDAMEVYGSKKWGDIKWSIYFLISFCFFILSTFVGINMFGRY